MPEEPAGNGCARLALGVPVGGTFVALVPLPAGGVGTEAVELVLGPGVPGNDWVPPAEPVDGELVPTAATGVGAVSVMRLPTLGVSATGAVALVARGVAAGATVALGPGEREVGPATGVPVEDELVPEKIADVLVGSAGNVGGAGGVVVGPIEGVDVTLAAIGVGLVGATGVAVCEIAEGAGVGVHGTSAGVDVPKVVGVVVAGTVVAGGMPVGLGVDGASVMVAGGVVVKRTVDVTGIVVLVAVGGGATGEADGVGFDGLVETRVGELVGEARGVTAPGGVTTIVGAGTGVFVMVGEGGALDAVTTALGPGVMDGVGVALEGPEMFESRFCTVDLAVADAITA